MEDIQVVDCEVEEEALQVHCGHCLLEVVVDHFAEFANERLGCRVGFGSEVDEFVFLNEVVKESLPVLEDGDPLIELRSADVPDVLEGKQILYLLLHYLENAWEE